MSPIMFLPFAMSMEELAKAPYLNWVQERKDLPRIEAMVTQSAKAEGRGDSAPEKMPSSAVIRTWAPAKNMMKEMRDADTVSILPCP